MSDTTFFNNMTFQQLLDKVPNEALFIHKTLTDRGFECYPVGGAVRDLLIGRKCTDYDFATNARPEEVASLFRNVIPTGIKHGTVTILHKNWHFEVTTYRIEGKYSDNRRPDEIRYAKSIEEDLSRRDFTINALALDIANRKIIDLFEGMQDLEAMLIRTIGDPDQRFNEDALRMLRACRFASTLGFIVEKSTYDSIKRNASLIMNISHERIRDEFLKIMASPIPSIGLEHLRESGMMQILMPELLEGYGLEQNRFHQYDVYYHNLASCDATAELTDDVDVRIAALFHDIGKPQSLRNTGDNNTFYNHEVISYHKSKHILRRLKFSNTSIQKILLLVRNHMFHYTEEWTDGAVRRLMRKADPFLKELFILREGDRIGSGKKGGNSRIIDQLKRKIDQIIEDENALKTKDLAINGLDIMRIRNIQPSKEVGLILEMLLQKVLDDPSLNTKENLEKLAAEMEISDQPSTEK